MPSYWSLRRYISWALFQRSSKFEWIYPCSYCVRSGSFHHIYTFHHSRLSNTSSSSSFLHHLVWTLEWYTYVSAQEATFNQMDLQQVVENLWDVCVYFEILYTTKKSRLQVATLFVDVEICFLQVEFVLTPVKKGNLLT